MWARGLLLMDKALHGEKNVKFSEHRHQVTRPNDKNPRIKVPKPMGFLTIPPLTSCLGFPSITCMNPNYPFK